ncbi:MAG: glycosyltransferase family 2 protein, partial [Marmoricola sp.]
MIVTALLVSHNGERWLPRVLEALAGQTARVDRVVAVDTGSSDGSAELIARALGSRPLSLPSDTSYGAAVAAGLQAAPAQGDDEWNWLIHDDSAPAPTCLAELRRVAESCAETTAALGPKLREWPTLRRLLEVGVTVTGTGRRETGLEPGEPDQGQHDEVDRVLAVNTAGMLVRRDVLEYFGFAPELPLFANDLDFGWRLAARSLQTHVVPSAVMFHAEAAYRGRRDAELARHHRRDARAAEMFVVLANGSTRWHAIRLVRMFLSGLLRAFGFSLVRAFPEARAELDALRVVYGAPQANHRARRQRQSAATAPAHELNRLLAPVGMPWRHGLDFVIDFVRAVAAIAADSARARLAAES